MLKNVLALVRPNSSSLAFVRTNMSANLNLKSRAPSAPTPAAPLPNPDPCFAPAGPASSERLNAAIRAETTWCWVASTGNRSSAWRQAARAALGSPACSAPSAVAARRLSSSACTRRRQEGQASRAGAICVPHCVHSDGARPGRSASVIYEDYAAAGRAATWYGPVTCRATPRLSFHASYRAKPAINKWIGLVMPIMTGAAYASAMITARPRALAGRPGRGDLLGAASLDALTPAATAAGEAARALHSFCSSRAISEESVTTTAV